MAQTTALIEQYIHVPPLVVIINEYLCPRDADEHTIARCGHAERCIYSRKTWKGLLRGGHIDLITPLVAGQSVRALNEGLFAATRGGHLDCVNLMIARGADDARHAIYYAYRYGHDAIIDRLTSPDIGECAESIVGACKSGRLDLVMRITDAETNYRQDYILNKGLRAACECGHTDIVEFMIERGADDFDGGLCGASAGGHPLIVERMIECGATAWNFALHYACGGGHLSLVEQMIARGADDFNSGLAYACYGGHTECINLMIACGATNFGSALVSACRGGNLQVVEQMIERCPLLFLNMGLKSACKGGHLNIINLLIERGADDWNEGAHQACGWDKLEIVEMMIDRGATRLDGYMRHACVKRNFEIVDMLIRRGANPASCNCGAMHPRKWDYVGP